ncbi:nitronate monooxygenase [Streptomyces sp. NPDC007205]|uniref:nitronate monooxygenase n=1 Tax=Streptomyces sp. NPDC007205 TaxID=3154316 RepID=UPI0033F3C593
MTSAASNTEMIIGITPFGEPDARLASAVSRAGGLGVLDLGTGDQNAREALAHMRHLAPRPFGVRVGARCRLSPEEIVAGKTGMEGGAEPHAVILGIGSPWQVGDVAAHFKVLVEVADLEQALEAVRAGAYGLVARGSESGGRVGELSSFALLQHLRLDIPVWVCGGIGPRTAAASMVGGACGVVVDSQLALLAESELDEAVAAELRSMDGSDTVLMAGHRVLHRRGPSAPLVPADDPETVAAMLGARDLSTQLLPVGQDGFLAARFAERWGDVGRTVRALTDAVRDAVRDDVAAQALRDGSAMSRAFGIRLPVAQGPMTQVSDQAGFADAVAADGALPFVALALANGAQTRAMLVETHATMSGRPWGVGMLGSAPEDIQSAQLDVVRELKPTHAIVASGRPSQAQALEQAGIRTFLHASSPVLLREFLEAGACRFVFKGSECGGPVGPWSGFPLWEAQLAVLEDFLSHAGEDSAQRLEVLLAGGVHNERSAAMVATIAAPLTARGVAVGVLMGTAYLFTEEAVENGAIQPLFQRQVRAARRTVLIRTAAGHVARCIPSPFSRDYVEQEAELKVETMPECRIRTELERLHVERLRIASKGEGRDSTGALSQVGEERQLTEGLFVAGEVAVLRSATTTISALHHSVTEGAADFLTRRADLLRERLRVGADEEPIAASVLRR